MYAYYAVLFLLITFQVLLIFISFFTIADRILRMLNLALLCEQSCDAKLATLSKDVQALFPQETIVRAGLFIA